jgi:hypothetical protein
MEKDRAGLLRGVKTTLAFPGNQTREPPAKYRGLCVRAFLNFWVTTGAGCARGRSALGRLFEGGEGLGQHVFGVAHPLGQLFLGPALQRRRELFHIPHFRHPRAGPVGLQAVGPAGGVSDLLIWYSLFEAACY